MTDTSYITAVPFDLPLLHHIAPGAVLTIAGRWKDSPHKHQVKLKSLPDGVIAAVWSDPSGARYDLTFNTRTREMSTPAVMLAGHEREELNHALMLFEYVEQLVGFVSPPSQTSMF